MRSSSFSHSTPAQHIAVSVRGAQVWVMTILIMVFLHPSVTCFLLGQNIFRSTLFWLSVLRNHRFLGLCSPYVLKYKTLRCGDWFNPQNAHIHFCTNSTVVSKPNFLHENRTLSRTDDTVLSIDKFLLLLTVMLTYRKYVKGLNKCMEWVLHKLEKKVRINICPQTVFEVQPPRSPDLSPLDLYLWGHFKIPRAFDLQFKMKVHFDQSIFMPVKPFATTAGPLKNCKTPWSVVSMSALIQLEDILGICCELWLDRK
jgi:hypothetical protein